MTFFTLVWRFVLDVLRPDTELSPELMAYCRSEGVDPAQLLAPEPEPSRAAVERSNTISWEPCQEDGTCVDSA